MRNSLMELREVRAAIGRAAAVIRDGGGIVLIGNEVVDSDAAVLPKDDSPFGAPACADSYNVAFQPRIRFSDEEECFQGALERIMSDMDEPEVENIFVEQEDGGGLSADEPPDRSVDVDRKGRRILTDGEVKAIATRARENYRMRKDGNSVLPPAYGLALRDGDRLCVLTNGKTLETYLAELVSIFGSKPLAFRRTF